MTIRTALFTAGILALGAATPALAQSVTSRAPQAAGIAQAEPSVPVLGSLFSGFAQTGRSVATTARPSTESPYKNNVGHNFYGQ